MEPSVSKGNKNSISVIPIFRNGTSILLDDLIFHVDKIWNFIFVLDTNPISVQGDRFRYIQVSEAYGARSLALRTSVKFYDCISKVKPVADCNF